MFLRSLPPESGASYYSVDAFAREAGIAVDTIPACLRILAENVLRHVGRNGVTAADLETLLRWKPEAPQTLAVPFHPARVLMQDYTGIPALVDLAALRDAMREQGREPSRINPQIPVDLVIDHSLIVDRAGHAGALSFNLAREFERNAERYQLARWAQGAFDSLRVVPPGNGILHQVNIERIAQVVRTGIHEGMPIAFPDTMVGTDSHSTMVNGVGVLGWGVGGIEAEAAMLGLPLIVPLGRIVGVRLTGELREGITATDLVLTLTKTMRAFGVIDALVEFCGPALATLPVADRVTLANMAPEFGSTCALFPIDVATLRYLELTGRDARQVALVEAYARAQGLWRDVGTHEPTFSAMVEFDLSTVEPTVAGPRKPHSRVALSAVPGNFREEMERSAPDTATLSDGAIVVAAITSCTNTSNPAVMLAAGLLARKAVARGLTSKPWVKTSLTPGSLVVGRYLEASGLQRDLDALGFQVAGYGCATCGGNSGELDAGVAQQIRDRDLVACAVLSGNRNFEARIHPLARANYLMSPPLVVAYAIAGHVGIDLTSEPLATDRDGKPVYLRELWPSNAEVAELGANVLSPELFEKSYATLFDGGPEWAALEAPVGMLFPWATKSTYIRRPPYLDAFEAVAAPVADIEGARALLMLGDGITTDHISPVGNIAAGSPAALHLRERGVASVDFNAYGSRRANHEVMVRGTFANIRLKNELAGGREGGITRHVPSDEILSVFDASERYAKEGVPLVIIAGRDYGAGSSRDWAAKGSALLGVRAVIAESFERIHRSNLVMMGILPLAFPSGVTRQTLRLDGSETFGLADLALRVAPRAMLALRIHRADGTLETIQLKCRIETPNEQQVWAAGGMMPFVLRRLGAESEKEAA